VATESEPLRRFYDELADFYHLIFEDWSQSIARQSEALSRILSERWGITSGDIIDAAVGVGTQSLGLAARGFNVIGADISFRAVHRARREAATRQLRLPVLAADFRSLPFRSGSADAIIACDNALPHLLSMREIRGALAEFMRCLRPRGAVMISMRDYATPPPAGTAEYRPYGEREWNGRKYFAEQEWHWNGPTYDLVLRVFCLDADSKTADLNVQTTYFAVAIADILTLMSEVGFRDVHRVDDVYYQPVLVGTAPAER